MRRYALRDDQWEKVKDILPGVCCLAPDVICIAEVLEGPPPAIQGSSTVSAVEKTLQFPLLPRSERPNFPLGEAAGRRYIKPKAARGHEVPRPVRFGRASSWRQAPGECGA
jgi:hypothetical protein